MFWGELGLLVITVLGWSEMSAGVSPYSNGRAGGEILFARRWRGSAFHEISVPIFSRLPSTRVKQPAGPLSPRHLAAQSCELPMSSSSL